jgi:hypothetical protein
MSRKERFLAQSDQALMGEISKRDVQASEEHAPTALTGTMAAVEIEAVRIRWSWLETRSKFSWKLKGGERYASAFDKNCTQVTIMLPVWRVCESRG